MKKEHIKQIVKWYALLKVPVIIYLIISMAIVPTIDALNSGDQKYKAILGAHRGNSTEYEENTLEAFESALEEEKYQFIEFDIQYTKDKKIAVIHQNNMIRIPKNLAILDNLTYEELQEKFDFHIPQYHEAMDLIDGKKPVNIEIKTGDDIEASKELVDFVIADSKKRNISDKILLSSPKEELIQYIEENYPEIKSGRVYWVTLYSIIPTEYTTKKFYEDGSQADFLILHGHNLKNVELLMKYKPADKTLIFWYFTDETYIIDGPDSDCEKFWEN